ncbi:progesterone-induced-blocking factor 1-like [Hydractinia symbiolongicarpus]|uniref:progesterone-induced-blocking factor 1-like n=1 Tax=Hydractinia symbiolongicarpus TaxID=13093 RepID=UPI00254D83C8|nr:progesterone-induced-blocking factor 1-like [Hydractinia symbiolongicarpus]
MTSNEKSSSVDSSVKQSYVNDDTTKSGSQFSLATNNTTNGSTLSTNTELETTNFSNASLTDVTSTLLSSSSNLTETDVEKSRNITRDLLLKKQLLHDVQKLKIEISQKDLLIDTLKADNMNRIDDLEDKLTDVNHEKQMMSAKYEAKLRMIQEEGTKKINKLRSDLQESLKSQALYKEKYEALSSSTLSSKKLLVDVELSEEEYLDMKGKSDEDLSMQEMFKLKVYERVRPLKVQNETLQQRLDLITSDLHDRESEIEQLRMENEEERKVRAELDIRCQRFQVQIEDLRSQLSHKTYRNKNYDNVSSERDALERQIVDFEKTCTVYKVELENKANQMEALRSQMVEQNQTLALLRQDKDYLSKQVNELHPRYKVLEERYEHTTKQLDEVKHSREELYEKYLNSRETYKREYEERMKKELEELSARTNNELNKIKESTTEMYERENRTLRDTKNSALQEQNRLMKSEKHLQQKFNELIGEFRQLQLSSDSKIAESQNEVKLKSFELDRVQLLHEEALNNVKQMVLQNDTLSKKMETISKEYYALKGSSERRLTEVEGRNQELESKLKIYEKLEQELDDVVMQAAEMTSEDDAERVLFAYGYGANVPSTAKRRMQQSVHLARRVLQLERANTSLRHDIERETKKRQEIAEELRNTTGLLNEAQQPYNYLIDSIRTRDEQNNIQKKTLSALENDIRTLKKENNDLKSSNNQMSCDLERLLNQREEISVIKQVLVDLKSSQVEGSFSKTGKTSSTIYGAHHRTSSKKDDLQTTTANPIVFTKSEPPSWYTKLKRQNDSKSRIKKK